MNPPSRKQGPRRPAPLSEERLERVRRLKEEIADERYPVRENFEAIFEDLIGDVLRGSS